MSRVHPVCASISICVTGTATTSDQKCVAKTGTLTFAPSETTKTITIEDKGDSRRSPTRLSTSKYSATAVTRCSPTTRGIG